MKDTLVNKLASFQASILVADKPDNQPIWLNQPPQAFGEGLEEARTAVTALTSTGALQSTTTTGSTDALKGLRDQFEASLHPLSRATFRCLKKLNRLEDAAKADLTPSDLHNSRAVALAGTGEVVLDLAEALTVSPAAGQPAPGEKYGVTAAAVEATETLWQRYSAAVGAPTSARITRKSLTESLPAQFAAAEELFAELDDYILQFNATDAGRRFIREWFNARRITDTGHRAAKPKETVVPA